MVDDFTTETRDEMKSKLIQVEFPQDLIDKLDAYAKEHERSRAASIRYACRVLIGDVDDNVRDDGS